MKKYKIILLIIVSTVLVSQSSWAQTLMEVEGELDVKGNRITNVQDPLIAQDVATKAYADSVLQSFFGYLAETNLQSFLDAGVTLQSLLDAGVTLQSLLDAGVTVQSLFDIGVSLQSFLDAGVTFQSLLDAGLPLQSLLDIGETLQSLLAAGVLPQSLLDEGISPINIINAGASTEDFIGSTYEGGIIFYMQPDGTGLVAAATDQNGGNGAEWGCLGTDIPGAIGSIIGTGQQNTIDIVAQSPMCSPPPNRAADICDALVLNGFNDWFLPSSGELAEMRLKIGQGAAAPNTNIGGFANTAYWSSSELNDEFALFFNFSGTNPVATQKSSSFRVRAIREF